MKTLEFLSFLQSRDIRLWVDGNDLRFEGPGDSLTRELRAEIGRRKREILDDLRRMTVQAPPLRPVARETHPPLSFAQQRLWFIDQLNPQSTSYTIPVAFRLRGALDVAALESSLNEMIRRHEILRTTISAIDGEPVQIIAPTLKGKLTVVHVDHLPAAERESEARRLMAEEKRRPFDLAEGPLLRAIAIRLEEEEHIFLLTMHHIISDGWSMSILYRELSALYNASVTGKPHPLPALPIQYADYAVWQRDRMQGEIFNRHLAYWKEQLAGMPASLDLPTDHLRPSIWTDRGDVHSTILPRDLAYGIQELSRREGVTMFVTLLAAFDVLLHRYTGQEDIAVGTPVAGRNRPEIEDLIGFFVNTLVLRTHLSGNPGFRQVLGRVRETCLDAHAHQDLPFEKLVEELRPERTLHQSPLLQVMFTLENVPKQLPVFAGMEVSPLDIPPETAKFDLGMAITDKDDGLQVSLHYKVDLFKRDTMVRLSRHFSNLLRGILADPDGPIRRLPLLTETERHQVLVEWSSTAADVPSSACLHRLFEAQVERTPDVMAIKDDSGSLTYRQLNRKANQLAHHLRTRGVGPEVVVGMCFERSLEMVIALLGILKAGGCFVPIDPLYPRERVGYILRNCQVSVIVTQKRFEETLTHDTSHIICLDADWPTISLRENENPPLHAEPRNLAYIIYTSGSTGNPKGVMIEHRSIVNVAEAMGGEFDIQAGDRVLQFFSINFDMSVCEIFSTLNRGGTLIIRTDSWLASICRFFENCIDESIAVLSLPTAFWHEMCSALASEDLVFPPSVRLVIIGGDRAHPDRWKQWRRTADRGIRLLYGYGPTEATVVTTLWELPRPAEYQLSRGEIPIGFPIHNVQVFILDTFLQPVPIGVRGELYIGGINLARGYVNEPHLTLERFIHNPFSDDPEARLYKTGDLAIFLSDGNIEFAGRLDGQVKIRGFRIEVNEIESTLHLHPQVNQAVVVARTVASGDKDLVAYVLPHQRTPELDSHLRRFLKERLPNYMIPTRFVFLDAFPLSPGGKVDRQALPPLDPTRSASDLAETFIGPRDELEGQLTQVWEKVLNIKSIGIRDNFFELGGHSLLAIRLLTEIEKQLGIQLSVASLFQGPTIQALAERIRREGGEASWSCLVPLQPGGRRTPFFCVAPAGAEVIGLTSLAHSLDQDQPFYGLQLPGPANARQPVSVSDMAARCLREMKSIQQDGPYLIGGTCMGGLVAYEMACQLHSQGKDVALLVLFDSSQPPPLISLREYIPRLLFHHLPRGQLFYCLKRDLAEKIRKLKRRFDRGPEAVRRYRVWKAHEQARRAYWPGTYPGRIILFQSLEFSIRFPEYVARWSALAAGGVNHHIIPATHRDQLDKECITLVAKQLKTYLQKLPAGER